MASPSGPPAAKAVYLPTAEQIAGGCAEARSLWSARDRMRRLRGRDHAGRVVDLPIRRNRGTHAGAVAGPA